MSVDKGLVAWVSEALEPMGAVSMRNMMGAATLYLDGIVFAIQDEGEIWFKADAETDAVWDAEGCERFTFDMGEGKTGSLNYRRAPSEIYDDPEELQRWARPALEAGPARGGEEEAEAGEAQTGEQERAVTPDLIRGP